MPRCDGIVAHVRLACALGVAALCAAILCVGCGWRESAGSGVEEGSPKSTVGTAPVADGDGSSADDSSAEDGSIDDPTAYEPQGFLLQEDWSDRHGYSHTRHRYTHDGAEQVDAYGLRLWTQFWVEYPQLSGDFEHLDEINRTIKDCAMETARDLYLNPTPAMIESVRLAAAELKDGSRASAHAAMPDSECTAMIGSVVSYAITYNNDTFISICFADNYTVGIPTNLCCRLRTVNINLQTGESYSLGDILTPNQDIADSFVDGYTKHIKRLYEETEAYGDIRGKDKRLAPEDAIGDLSREEFKRALLGQDDGAGRLSVVFFVTKMGRVHLGFNFQGNMNEYSYGKWWEMMLTSKQVAATKKDSSLWNLLPARTIS